MDFPEVPDKDRMPQDLLAKALHDAAPFPSRSKPYWVQVMGIPGAGKTLFVEQLAKALQLRAPYALAANDVFLVQIPEYLQMQDRALAFETWDSVARAIAFTVLEDLIARKADVIYEHSTVYPAVRDLMYFVKECGYELILVRIDVPLDIAKQRAIIREKETVRHVPEYVIEERVGIVEERWSELTKIADFSTRFANEGAQTPQDTFRTPVEHIIERIKSL